MGIRIRNLHNFVISLKYTKTLTATVEQDVSVVPFAGFISNIVAKLGNTGSGSTNSVVDINLNGTTIFSTATKITLAATTGVATYSPLATKPTALAAGDVISMDIDQISVAPRNLVVQVTVTRTPIDDASNVADHDDVY
jgi:hypothetical protein